MHQTALPALTAAAATISMPRDFEHDPGKWVPVSRKIMLKQ
jgi:hypothetical protein